MKQVSVESEMKRFLEDEYGQDLSGDKAVVKTASQVDVKVSNFKKVVAELVACAEQLDEMGHPLADEVDSTLEDISKELAGE